MKIKSKDCEFFHNLCILTSKIFSSVVLEREEKKKQGHNDGTLFHSHGYGYKYLVNLSCLQCRHQICLAKIILNNYAVLRLLVQDYLLVVRKTTVDLTAAYGSSVWSREDGGMSVTATIPLPLLGVETHSSCVWVISAVTEDVYYSKVKDSYQ